MADLEVDGMGLIEPEVAETALRAFLGSNESSIIGPIRDAVAAAFEKAEVVPASQLAGAVDRVMLVETALKAACQDLGLNEGAPARYIEEAERGLALRGGQCAAPPRKERGA